MKKNTLFLFAFLFVFTSCNNYLDFPPEAEVPVAEFFQTQDDATKAANAMYGYLRSWDISAFNYLILSELASDNLIKGSSPGDGSWANAFPIFQFTATDGQIRDYFNSRYKGINLSNQVITNLPAITMSETLKTQIIAEAKFLRAFHYFFLVRAFGGVPIVDKVPVGPEGMIRATADETWDFIETDLLEAIPNLPESYPNNLLGHATKWAAKALLAKVYLYREKWTECKQTTDEIINSGKFSLYPDFYKLFRPEQEFCSESIFEIVATQVAGNNGITNSQFAEVQAVRGQFGWGWFAPTDNLAAAFDAAGDVVRKKVTILYKGDHTEDGDSITGISLMEGVVLPRYSGKAYVPSRIKTVTGPYGSDQNIRTIRYAEVLLINAEATLKTGGNAAQPLNLVRNRVGLPSILNPTIQDIWNERRLELAGEQDRFWDLVRTKQAEAVLGPQGFKVGKNELYPIPQQEIELSGGLLTQNPGW
jgi:hypothetical protein